MERWDGISTRQGGLKLNPGVENSHVIRPLELDLSPGGGGTAIFFCTGTCR